MMQSAGQPANRSLRIFIYEHLTGGGTLAAPDEPVATSLLTEGFAMATALAADFAVLPNCEVVTLVDHRLLGMPWPDAQRSKIQRLIVENDAQHWSAFVKGATSTDYTVVIAPEIDGALERRCRMVEGLGRRLLGPSGELVHLAADKLATCAHLADHGIAVPPGTSWRGGEDWPSGVQYPVVLKPRWGAGSWQVQRLPEVPPLTTRPAAGDWLIEHECRGTPASISALCGPRGQVLLPPCKQRLSDDGRFTYLGGSFSLPAAQAARARHCLKRVLGVLPPAVGYIGVDLILGEDANGRDDRVIEINPRMTTSYLGLRALCADNLAAAMWRCAEGELPDLRWRSQPLSFDNSGRLS